MCKFYYRRRERGVELTVSVALPLVWREGGYPYTQHLYVRTTALYQTVYMAVEVLFLLLNFSLYISIGVFALKTEDRNLSLVQGTFTNGKN